ncbi:hypothetical protein B7494_g7285 [Chlorociboria aeruginascens]|nr:hypothetical protein B7494_g7285 [Chlorociboria aeruginascens]
MITPSISDLLKVTSIIISKFCEYITALEDHAELRESLRRTIATLTLLTSLTEKYIIRNDHLQSWNTHLQAIDSDAANIAEKLDYRRGRMKTAYRLNFTFSIKRWAEKRILELSTRVDRLQNLARLIEKASVRKKVLESLREGDEMREREDVV